VSIVKALKSDTLLTSAVANTSIVFMFIREQHRLFHEVNDEVWSDPKGWQLVEILDLVLQSQNKLETG
jgi:hypothetical protein